MQGGGVSKDGGRVGLCSSEWREVVAVSGGQRGLSGAAGAGDEGGASGFVAHNVRFAVGVMVYISKLQGAGEDGLWSTVTARYSTITTTIASRAIASVIF